MWGKEGIISESTEVTNNTIEERGIWGGMYSEALKHQQNKIEAKNAQYY